MRNYQKLPLVVVSLAIDLSANIETLIFFDCNFECVYVYAININSDVEKLTKPMVVEEQLQEENKKEKSIGVKKQNQAKLEHNDLPVITEQIPDLPKGKPSYK